MGVPARVNREATPTETRTERRRRKTRSLLLAAAHRIIARRGSLDAVPIGEITAEADVATGSFYNHFESKDQLLEAVVTAEMEHYGEILDEVTLGVSDPAEACAIGMRLTLGMVRSDPIWGAFVAHTGLYIASIQSSLLHRLAGDLHRGFETGRFNVPDRVTSLALVGGAILGAMIAEGLKVLPDDASCLACQQLLELLGVPAEEAAGIARQPLPQIPEALERDRQTGSWIFEHTEESATR
jgi:AcrR family transcriptional regulator